MGRIGIQLMDVVCSWTRELDLLCVSNLGCPGSTRCTKDSGCALYSKDFGYTLTGCSVLGARNALCSTVTEGSKVL
jgi:hypothetical protein